MDAQAWVQLFLAGANSAELLTLGLTGAAFLWMGLLIVIEGNHKKWEVWGLSAAVIGLALFAYAELFMHLLDEIDGPFAFIVHLVGQPKSFIIEGSWWCVSVTSFGWYIAILLHTSQTFSHKRWRWPSSGLVFFSGVTSLFILYS